MAAETVKTLSWECDTGAYAFYRDESGSWRYELDEAFPVDGGRLKPCWNGFESSVFPSL